MKLTVIYEKGNRNWSPTFRIRAGSAATVEAGKVRVVAWFSDLPLQTLLHLLNNRG